MLVLKRNDSLRSVQKQNLKSVASMGRQQGFTLMEVMIAAFVLAVGMLGSTAMMLRGMQQADETNYESMAVQSAVNMAERMRSNIRGQGTSGSFYEGLKADAAAVQNCSNTCTSQEVARHHAYIWGLELEDSMPGVAPKGQIQALQAGANDAVYKIIVEWDGFKRTSTTSADSVINTYEMIFQP